MKLKSIARCTPCRSIAVILGAAALFAACSNDNVVPLGSVYVKSELIIASNGGAIEVAAADHEIIRGAKISIPAGALERDTTITIAYDPSSITGDSESIGPTVEFGPDGTQFLTPAVVTIPYQGTIDRERLRVFVKDASGTRTIPAHELALDEAAKTVRFQVSHFTRFQCGNGTPPAGCDPTNDCGPQPGLPSWICADGTVGGPTGNCVRNADGSCGWEVNWCPMACDATVDCGPIPELALICPDGSTAIVECNRQANGNCGWDFHCGNACDPAAPGNGGTGGGFVPPPNTCPCTCPDGSICDAATGQCQTTQIPCGNNVCGDGEYCCNESCGTCVPLGAGCTDQECTNDCTNANGTTTACPPGTICDPTTGQCTPDGSSCGNNTCGTGEYCCNASCGTCAPFGAACPAVQCNTCGTDPGSPVCPPNTICDAAGQCVSICGPNDCGPAPAIANWMCEDGSTGGPTGNCVPANGTTSPTPGGGNAPIPAPVCEWEIIWCPRVCENVECGPQPALPNTTCPDGTIAGPTGQCRRAADGSCAWEIVSCP